jgi:capsule polysaccharide export protein KpsE/RkpR
MSNRHPVDELADTRAEIKRLQDNEAYLRQQLEQSGANLKGDEYEARLDRKSSARLDRKLVEAKFGRKALDGCFKSSEFTTVTLWRKINKPEIYQSLQEDIQDEVPF